MPWPLDDKPTNPVANALLGMPAQDLNAVPQEFRGMAPESPIQPGMRDNTGHWFLKGDKPVYANASRSTLDSLFGPDYAKQFDAYQRFDRVDLDGNPSSFWVKPDLSKKQINALNELGNFQRTFSPSRASLDQWDQYHRLQGNAYGYAPEKIEAYVQSKQAKANAMSERAIGAGILGNTQGGSFKGGWRTNE